MRFVKNLILLLIVALTTLSCNTNLNEARKTLASLKAEQKLCYSLSDSITRGCNYSRSTQLEMLEGVVYLKGFRPSEVRQLDSAAKILDSVLVKQKALYAHFSQKVAVTDSLITALDMAILNQKNSGNVQPLLISEAKERLTISEATRSLASAEQIRLNKISKYNGVFYLETQKSAITFAVIQDRHKKEKALKK